METLAVSKTVQTGGLTRTSCRELIFSDYLIFSTFALGIFLLISRPLFGVQLSNTPFKHIPLALFLPAFVFHQIGRTLFDSNNSNNKGLVFWLWPFFLLGSYATIGSLLAKFTFGENETFLTLGVYLLATPLFYIWGRTFDNITKIVRPLVFLWGTSSIIAVIGAFVRYGQDESLHEIEFWVLSFFLYSYFTARTSHGRLLSLLILIFSSLLTQKLTGYAIGIGAIGYIFLVKVHSSISPRWRIFVFGVSTTVTLLCFGLLALGFIYFQEYLPSGNVSVRLHQYELALTSFFNSPLWGKAYTGSSGEIFIESTKSFNLPTHSDLLDLLKQGGLIAFVLWTVGIFKSIKLFLKSGLRNLEGSAFFHAMTFMTGAIVFSCAFNPLLLKPPFSFVIWGMVSLAISVADVNVKERINDS
jgi:hypothetical protein